MNCYRCKAPLQEGEGFWNEGGPGYGKCGACVRAILAEQPATCKPDLQVQPLSFREQAFLAALPSVLDQIHRACNAGVGGYSEGWRREAAIEAFKIADEAERVARGGVPQSELDKIKENGNEQLL